MGLRLALLLAAVSRAAGDDAPASPNEPVVAVDPPPAPPPDAAAMVDAAVAEYLAGRPAEARARLQGVLAIGPDLPPAVRRRALAYLGDILYSEEGPTASKSVFDALLREDPTFRLDPFEHPADVCRYVDQLRDPVRLPVEPPPVTPRPPPRYPVALLMPGGVPYFRDGRTGAGVAVASVQAVTLAGSFVTYALVLPRVEDPRYSDPDALSRQVGVAQRIVVEQPDSALNALRQLLNEPNPEGTA